MVLQKENLLKCPNSQIMYNRGFDLTICKRFCKKLILITGCCIINNNFQLNSQFIVILLIFVENGDIIALLDSHEIEISDL